MAINETQKLNRLAHFSQKEFWNQGSLLKQTRLDNFILIAFLIHALVIVFQLLAPAISKGPLAPPPIKIKYVETKKPDSFEKKGTIVDAPKPKKVEKKRKKPSELLASADSRTHANKKPSIQKKYRRKKTVAPQASGKPQMTQLAKAPAESKKLADQSKQKAVRKYKPLPLSGRGTLAPEVAEKKDQQTASQKLGSRGVLSMLDGFDAEKYAMQDTQTPDEDDFDDDEPISLDTTEAKYVSYFNRIKHQIQRVWTYPAQAAQKGVSGQVSLRFQISREGNLLGVQVVDNSGVEILDMAAIKAVKEAAPYYPFPITITKNKLTILATFVYSPSYNQLSKQ